MNRSVLILIIASTLLRSPNADALTLEAAPPWQIGVAQADFIGTVRCVGNSYTSSIDGTNGERVLVQCVVTDSVKGVPADTNITLDLGPAKNRYGDPVPTALGGYKYFVVAYCKWGPPNSAEAKPPADYFLTTYGTSSWIRLPWSFSQSLRFMRAHGSDHSTFESFIADVRDFLAQPTEEQELLAIKAYARHELREWFPLIDSETPTREQAAILNARNLQSAINALFEFKAVPSLAKDVLLESAGPHALEYLQTENEPHIILPGDYLRTLARYVEWRASPCGLDEI